QLFSDELDEERRRLLARGASQAASPAVNPDTDEVEVLDDVDIEPIPLRPRGKPNGEGGTAPGGSNRGSSRVLTVDLRAQDYEVLKALADRHEMAVGSLVGEIVAAYLKYK
ncbi:MAG TPA: hypothetical protein VMB50_21260, partial [Myxococcales bacterium]|nr:hypothetical protein [Myxococcales bacterium]